MLKDYDGPANSTKMFEYLIGERIAGALVDGGHLILIMESGDGLVFTSFGGNVGPAYFRESRQDVERRLTKREEEIASQVAMLHSLTVIQELIS